MKYIEAHGFIWQRSLCGFGIVRISADMNNLAEITALGGNR
jgi:hypothetical protein